MPDPAPQVVVAEEPEKPTPEPAQVNEPTPAGTPEEQLAAKIKADFEALYGPRLKQLENSVHGGYRVQQKLEQENAQLKAQLAQGQSAKSATPAPTTPHSDDPWAGIQDGPVWRQRIESLAEEKAKRIFEQQLSAWQQDQLLKQQQTQHVQTLESSKKVVIEKYPQLHPETGTDQDAVSQAYSAACDELKSADPNFEYNPYGPILAMYRMEETLKEQSNGKVKTQTRATVTSTPASRQNLQSQKSYTLTREQMDFCKYHNLDPVQYAKTLAATEANQQVSA